MTLSNHLKKRSKEICLDNKCSEDNHNCESFAYINKEMRLLDICASDYFQGSSEPYAAISLPWNGTQVDLEYEIEYQVSEQENLVYIKNNVK